MSRDGGGDQENLITVDEWKMPLRDCGGADGAANII